MHLRGGPYGPPLLYMHRTSCYDRDITDYFTGGVMMYRILTILSLLLFTYESYSLILPMNIPPLWKTVGMVTLFGAAAKNMLFLKLSDWQLSSHLPRWLIWGFALLFNFSLLILMPLIIKDIVRFVWIHVSPIPFPATETSCIIIALGVILAVFGTHQGTRPPKLEIRDIPIRDLPEEFENSVIVMMADLHAGMLNRRRRFDKIVDTVNSLNPDIVVIPGDFVDGTVFAHLRDLFPLARLQSKWGVYAVSGNHEYYSGFKEWKKNLTSLGINFLENTFVPLGNGPKYLILAGVSDPQGLNYGFGGPDLYRALTGAPGGPVILLAHRPAMAHEACQTRVALQLSGHTHGGQMPLLNAVIAVLNGGFFLGMYRVAQMYLYVSPGTSQWDGLPMRFFTRSEITVFKLHRAK